MPFPIFSAAYSHQVSYLAIQFRLLCIVHVLHYTVHTDQPKSYYNLEVLRIKTSIEVAGNPFVHTQPVCILSFFSFYKYVHISS